MLLAVAMLRDQEPVTRWLQAAAAGDAEAAGRVVAWAYDELEELAAKRLRREFGRVDVTLEPAALVSETFLKLLRNPATSSARSAPTDSTAKPSPSR